MIMPKHARMIGLPLLLATASSAQAIVIQFDYSYDSNGFFSSNAIAKNLLETAGDYLAQRLSDDLDAIVSSGQNNFTAIFTNPATGTDVSLSNYSVAANTLIVFAGARDLGATLGQGGPGSYAVRYTDSTFYDTVRTRGEVGVDNTPPTDFAPWGGSITFDIDANWYFDPDPDTDESFIGNDFYSVALHELGHVLGIGTSDSWNGWITNGVFTGPASMAVHGSAVPVTNSGDHWANGTMSQLPDGTPQEAAMDPDLTTGTRKRFTVLDLAGLSDVGWEVTPVPVPAAIWLFGSGLLLLGSAVRRKS